MVRLGIRMEEVLRERGTQMESMVIEIPPHRQVGKAEMVEILIYHKDMEALMAEMAETGQFTIKAVIVMVAVEVAVEMVEEVKEF